MSINLKKELEIQVGKLTTDLSNYKNTIVELEAKYNASVEQIKSLNTEIEQFKASNADLLNKFNDLNTKNVELTNKLTEEENKNKNVEEIASKKAASLLASMAKEPVVIEEPKTKSNPRYKSEKMI